MELLNCLIVTSCSNFLITLLITYLAVSSSLTICLSEIFKDFFFVTATFSFKEFIKQLLIGGFVQVRITLTNCTFLKISVSAAISTKLELTSIWLFNGSLRLGFNHKIFKQEYKNQMTISIISSFQNQFSGIK
jgi:hypothetical protein